MKVKQFESFEEFENECNEDNQIEDETICIVKTGKRICADLTTVCKNYKTAINRLFKEIDKFEAFKGWKDGIIESCENGYFQDIETWQNTDGTKTYGDWHYQVEELDENLWYIEITTLQ